MELGPAFKTEAGPMLWNKDCVPKKEPGPRIELGPRPDMLAEAGVCPPNSELTIEG